MPSYPILRFRGIDPQLPREQLSQLQRQCLAEVSEARDGWTLGPMVIIMPQLTHSLLSML